MVILVHQTDKAKSYYLPITVYFNSFSGYRAVCHFNFPKALHDNLFSRQEFFLSVKFKV